MLKTAQSCVRKYLEAHATQVDESFKSSVVRLGQTAIALASAFKRKMSIFGVDMELDIQKALDKEKDYLADSAGVDRPVDFDSIYFDLHEQMEQITGRSNNDAGVKLNLLFLIDDLDRCLPEKAVQVMESVKLFLDARGCAFVLALDEEVVERGIMHRYRDYLFQGGGGLQKSGDESVENQLTQLPITGAEYLEKIIQLPIHLPRPED